MKQLLAIAVIFSCATGWSAVKQNAKFPHAEQEPAWDLPASPDHDAVRKDLKENKKNRSPANDVSASQVNNSEFGQFRARMLAAAKNPAKWDAFIADIDDNYGQFKSNSVKYFAAQVALLRPMRSVIYRLRPLFETKARKSLHSASVTAVRNAAAAMAVFMPGEGREGTEWRTAFDYVVAPSANSSYQVPEVETKDGRTIPAHTVDTNKQFYRVADVQWFLVNEYAPKLHKAIERITPIYNNPGSEPIVWDNEIFFPRSQWNYTTTGGRRDDNPERYHIHGRAEIGTVLSSLWFTHHRAAMFVAYKQEELFDVAWEMGKLQGLDGWGPLDYRFGISKEDKKKVMNKFRNTQFLTLIENVGKSYMGMAWRSFTEAVKLQHEIWHTIVKQDRSAISRARENAQTVLNYVVLQTGEKENDYDVDALMDFTKGKQRVFSTITGEYADVNLKLIFTNPPPDLKKLMPTTFTPEKETSFTLKDAAGKVVNDEKGKPIEWRNYFGGRAATWDAAAWKADTGEAYVSAPSGKLSDALRVFRSTWGGDILAGPLAFAVR